MVDTLWPANAVSGAPSYNGRMLRQTGATALAGATTARPLGARSGVRPGTPTNTVTATSTTWTVQPFAGVADVMTAAEASAYQYAFDAVVTGAVTAAHATLPRKDIIYVAITDPAESVGATATVTRKYLAGTAAASPVAPTVPGAERGYVIAEINVPASGGGSPTVTWVAPYSAGAGGIVPFLTEARLDAWTTAPEGQYADVFADSTANLNGLYRRSDGLWVPQYQAGVIAPVAQFQINADNVITRRSDGIVEGTLSITRTTGGGIPSNAPFAVISGGFRPVATYDAPATTSAGGAAGVCFGQIQTNGNVLAFGPGANNTKFTMPFHYKGA